MNLDPRIIEGKKPLTCFDLKEAKQFLGEKGYFSDFFSKYAHISDMKEDVLQSLDEHHDEAFLATRNKWEFFLPAEWVKEPEKKYRAFTNEEFVKLFDSGKLHSIRLKDSSTQSLERLIITDIYVQGDYLYAKLNSSTTGYSPEYFFSNCEYLDGKEWKPFGVEE